LTSTGYKIDLNGGKLTFDVGEYHAEFGLFKDYDCSLSSLACCGCDVVISDDFIQLIDVCRNDPHEFDYVSTEGYGLDCAKVNLVDHLQLSIVKDKPYAFNDGYLCD